MVDRELLALAAQAAGYFVRWHDVWQCFVHVGPHNITQPPSLAGQRMVWVPLEDDGDALRLAVNLRLSVSMFDDAVGIGVKGAFGYREYDITPDPDTATRRAIVRAAAAIGQSKHE